MSLVLDYIFSSDPNPIRVSPSEQNPNVIDLQVIVSNPSTFNISVTKIEIEIPTGENASRAISSVPNLPGPQYDASIPWTITSAGSTVTITPTNPENNTLTNPIIFKLPEISVNETEGVVPVTISEYAPTRQTDSTTYSLSKLSSDFPVTQFYAQPSVLDSLDQTVTIYWTGSDEVVYSLHSDSWNPKPSCLSGGTCFTAEQGQDGVVSNPLVQTTTFSLDVVKPDQSGKRVILATLQLTVDVMVPALLQQSYANLVLGSALSVHAIALNASRVEVLWDANPVADNLPTDTYTQGYSVIVPFVEGTHNVTLEAYNSNNVRTTLALAPVQLSTPSTISTGTNSGPVAVAVTPNGNKVYVCNQYTSTISVFDVDAEPRPVTIDGIPSPAGIAIAPDGDKAYVSLYWSGKVGVLDLATNALDPQISVGSKPGAIAISPDGSRAYVCNQGSNTVSVIDLSDNSVEKTIEDIPSPVAVAVTPDNATALVSSAWNPSRLFFIDTSNQSVAWNLSMSSAPSGIAVTADSQTAFVSNPGAGMVSVVDIQDQTAEQPISGLSQPGALALNPDGQVLLVCSNIASGAINLINVASHQVITQIGLRASMPTALAITPNGEISYVANASSSNVSVLT